MEKTHATLHRPPPLLSVKVGKTESVGLAVMEDQRSTKRISTRTARKRLNTICEWEEYEFAAEKRANTEVPVIHQSRRVSEMLSVSKQQESTIQSNGTGVKSPTSRSQFTAVLCTAYSECSADSPLKGTPWEDAAFQSVRNRRIRQLRRQRSAKEKEYIEFWSNLFG